MSGCADNGGRWDREDASIGAEGRDAVGRQHNDHGGAAQKCRPPFCAFVSGIVGKYPTFEDRAQFV